MISDLTYLKTAPSRWVVLLGRCQRCDVKYQPQVFTFTPIMCCASWHLLQPLGLGTHPELGLCRCGGGRAGGRVGVLHRWPTGQSGSLAPCNALRSTATQHTPTPVTARGRLFHPSPHPPILHITTPGHQVRPKPWSRRRDIGGTLNPPPAINSGFTPPSQSLILYPVRTAIPRVWVGGTKSATHCTAQLRYSLSFCLTVTRPTRFL